MAPIRRISLVVLAMALLIFNAAPAFSDSSPHASRHDYKKALKRWTRADELYQREDFYASLSWHATYLSAEFVSAQANEIGRIYDHTSYDERRIEREMFDRFAGQTVFFVSFYGYDYKSGDLADKEPQWILRLEVDGQRYAPVKIEPVKKPTPLDKQLFPFINTWSRHYYVYFTGFASVKSEDVHLRINGPYSNGHLNW